MKSVPTADDSATPVTIRFWGVRGSVPVPGPETVRYGGNTSCVEVRVGNQILVLDAGTGLRNLGRALVQEFQGRALDVTLLLTHTHWDHIQGLPFFAPIYQPQCRLRILGYEGARESLVHILSGQMESPYFPVSFNELPGRVEIEELRELNVQVGSVRVEACLMNHPGFCVGYRISTGTGSLVYIPDYEPDRADLAREEAAKLAAFLQGADVLILDAQYDSEEYRAHAGWGHNCVDEAVAIALRAGAKKLYLFHHDPDHDDAKVAAMTQHAQKLVREQNGALLVEAAQEGAVVKLPVAVVCEKRMDGRVE